LDRLQPVVRHPDVLPAQLEQHRQALRGIDIVVHDQNAEAVHEITSLRGETAGFSGSRMQPLAAQGQGDDEFTPLARARAERTYGSTVHLDDGSYQRQPDPEAALSAVERAVRLREEIEDMWEDLAGDSDAVVLHADPDLGPLLFGRQRDVPF